MSETSPYRYNFITLKFPEQEAERRFSVFSFNYDRQAFNVMSIAAIIVNLLLIISDYSKTGEWVGPLAMRSIIVFLLLTGFLIIRGIKEEQPQLLQVGSFMVVLAFTYCFFIGMSLIKYPDYSFPNSIISVVFFVVTMGGLRFRNAVIFLLITELSYFLMVFGFSENEFWKSQGVALSVNAALSVAVAYLIERARRNTFIKNQIVQQQNDELESAGALKNKLFSILSHDLRGPVNKIIAMVDMLKKEHISIEEFKVHTAKVEWEMKNTVSFMENMLFWSKSLMNGYQINPTQIDIKGLIDKNIAVWRDMIAEKKMKLNVEIPRSLFVNADEEMLNICIRNLLSNAIKFTTGGGSITIGSRVGDAFTEIFVSDSGVGIDPEKQKELFSIKTVSTLGTQGEKGTGLGLHLVKEFTERNGGQIFYVSQPGKGSTFTIRLPN